MAENELPTVDRATTALDDFRLHAPAAFVAQDPELLVRRGQTRARQRRGLAVTAAAATITVAAAAAYLWQPAGLDPVPTADSITDVDWTDTAIVLPESTDASCPTGRQRIRPQEDLRLGQLGQVSTSAGDVPGAFQVLPSSVAYGDLAGDARPEAALIVRCLSGTTGGLAMEGSRIIVVSEGSDQGLVGLGYAGTPNAEYLSVGIKDGALLAQMRYDHASLTSWGTTSFDVAFTQTLAWDGSAFHRVSGRAQPLRFKPGKDALGDPIRLVAILREQTVVCPSAEIRLSFGQATVAGYTYQPMRNPVRIDLDRDGNEELAVGLRCVGPGYDATSLYVFTQGPDGFIPLDVPFGNDGSYELLDLSSADDGHLTISIKEISSGAASSMTLTWDGHEFSPRVGEFSTS